MIIARCCLLLLMLFLTRPLFAGEQPEMLCRYTTAPPVIDGALDDRAWLLGEPLTAFHALGAGTMASHQTVAVLIYDDTHLYVAAQMRKEPGERLAEGSLWNGDALEIFLDPGCTGERYYQIAANTRDLFMAACHFGSPANTQWPGDVSSAAAPIPGGWAIEFAIPFAPLGTTPTIGDTWGANICRNDPRHGLATYADLQGGFHQPGQFALLRFAAAAEQPAAYAETSRRLADELSTRYQAAVSRLQEALRQLPDDSPVNGLAQDTLAEQRALLDAAPEAATMFGALRRYWLLTSFLSDLQNRLHWHVDTARLFNNSNTGATATLQQELLSQPAIAHPAEPFVRIFLEGGSDSGDFGFKLNGEMTIEDWSQVLLHVGYLGAYSDVKPAYPRWTIHQRDVAVRGAQAIGRFTGGCVMGLGDMREAYADPLALRMDYFFHDWEGDKGVPGGDGTWRLRVDHTSPASLASAPARSFDCRPGAPMATFRVDLGLYVQNYVFGGATPLIVCRDDLADTDSGWAIGVSNTDGYHGTTHFTFTSNGRQVLSQPVTRWRYAGWHRLHVIVEEGGDAETVTVSIGTDDLPDATARLPRPQVAHGRLAFVAGVHPNDERLTDLDSLRVSGSGGQLLASYDMESSAGNEAHFGQAVSPLPDMSGNGHVLTATGAAGAFTRISVSGMDPSLFAEVKQRLVDDLLAVRREHGVPPPELITDWRISGCPGRFAVWRQAGYTVGNSVYYLNGDLQPGFANLPATLDTRCSRWAAAEGSRWNSAWLGNVNSKVVLTPDQWQSLLTFAILDGNRWFFLFPAMSRGHFAPIDTEGRALMARTNARVVYALAQVASYFQPTAATLAESTFIDTDISIYEPNICARMRVNEAAGQAWFAAMHLGVELKDVPSSIVLSMPRAEGTVTDAVTGRTWAVTDGTFALRLTANAHLLHFVP